MFGEWLRAIIDEESIIVAWRDMVRLAPDRSGLSAESGLGLRTCSRSRERRSGKAKTDEEAEFTSCK